jgi:16S rRNA G966 N2-methylase RsmD
VKTLWYMGVKTRLIPNFIEDALAELAPEGSSLLDVFSGTAAVATASASRFRVVANDVQGYAAAIARAYLLHDEARKAAFLEALDPARDLGPRFEENYAALAGPLERALAREDAFLLEHGLEPAARDPGAGDLREPASDPRAVDRERRASPSLDETAYRTFALEETPRFEETRETRLEPPFDGAHALLSRRAVLERRSEPAREPYLLATAYYPNVYLGIRQAIATDSLKFAIDRLDPHDPFFCEKRAHYLAALLHALSVTTSATSHFCQPRGLGRASEVQAVLGRRAPSIASRLVSFSNALVETVREIEHQPGNAVFRGDWRRLFRDGGARDEAWAAPEARADVVYIDPPYTSDNYSRFYHLLEVVTDYDYPPLDVRAGKATKGRYPEIERRHQSAFCRRAKVEGELHSLLGACARAGAAAVVSYSRESGLLLRKYREDEGLSERASLERFQDLARASYGKVELRERRLAHSGQGDSNRVVTELLLLCRDPILAKRSPSRRGRGTTLRAYPERSRRA